MYKKMTGFLLQKLPIILPGAAALFFLILFVWDCDLTPGEENWMQTLRNIFSGDILLASSHCSTEYCKPVLNPWVSLLSFLPVDDASPWMIRIPGIGAAVLLLYSVIYTGRKFFSSSVGIAAGWITLSTYAFLFTGRYADADMIVCSAALFAAAWAAYCKERSNFSGYFCFYLICFFCVLATNIPFVAVPLIAAGALLRSEGAMRRHLNWKHAAGLFAGIALFLLFSAAVFWYKGNGLPRDWMVWLNTLKEDHLMIFDFVEPEKPWYFYIKQLFRLSLPWTALAVIIFFAESYHFKKIPGKDKALLFIIAASLVLFSAASVKRWYVMTAVVPFISLLIAQWLCREEKSRWEEILQSILYYFVIGSASAGILTLCVLPVMAYRIDVVLPGILFIAPAAAGAAVFVFAAAAEYAPVGEGIKTAFGISERLAVILVGTAVMCGSIISCCVPALDFFRSTRDFVRDELVPAAENIPDANVVLLAEHARGDIIYYLGRKMPPAHFSLWDNEGKFDEDLFSVFAEFIKWRCAGPVMIISDRKSASDIADHNFHIKGWDVDAPFREEPGGKYGDDDRRIVAWILEGGV